jgi:hypothetical protein
LEWKLQSSEIADRHEVPASEYLFHGRFTRVSFVLVPKTQYRLLKQTTKLCIAVW